MLSTERKDLTSSSRDEEASRARTIARVIDESPEAYSRVKLEVLSGLVRLGKPLTTRHPYGHRHINRF